MSPVITRHKVAALVGQEAALFVSRIDHAELEFGRHWRWTGCQVYTAEGVELIVAKLAEVDEAAALALQAGYAELVAKHAPAVPVVEPAERIERERTDRELVAPLHHGPVHDRANGYQPEEF